jgi:hypothetical protein
MLLQELLHVIDTIAILFINLKPKEMKTLSTFLVFLFLILFLPQKANAQFGGFNYKALITENGNVLSNRDVTIRFTIIQQSPVYTETVNTTTDENGIVSVTIGKCEDPAVDEFCNIDWKSVTFLKVEIDAGNGYVDYGTNPFSYVPYAKYAEKSGNDFSGDYNDLSNKPDVFRIKGTNDPATGYSQSISHSGRLYLGDTIDDNTSQLVINKSSDSYLKGLYINIESEDGNSIHYGSYNKLTGTGNGIQYGVSTFIDNSGNSYHYGNYNKLSGTGSGNHYGSCNELTGTGTGNHYGNCNMLSGSGSGNHEGVYNHLKGSGSGFQFGINTYIENSGNGIHYGSYNYLTGSGSGNKYGSYNKIVSIAGGTHYAVYGEAEKTGSYAGYFKGQLYVSNKIGIGTETPTGQINVIPAGNIYGGGNTINFDNAGLLVGTTTEGLVFDANQIESNGNILNLNTSSNQNVAIAAGGGNVGVGTRTPEEKLQIGDGSEDCALKVYAASGKTSKLKLFENDNYGFEFIYDGSPDKLYLKSTKFSGNDTIRMTWLKSGEVGIGTENPRGRLEVNTEGEWSKSFKISAGDGKEYSSFKQTSKELVIGNTAYPDNNESPLYKFVNKYDESLLLIGPRGKIAINGAPITSYGFTIPNSGSSSNLGRGLSSGWDTYSDKRIKSNIKTIGYGLQTVMQLKPSQYLQHSSGFEDGKLVLKDDETPAKQNIGFIAQELYEVVPEAVNKPGDENKELWSIDYDKLVPILTKAIQEQQKEIAELKKEIEKLKRQQK